MKRIAILVSAVLLIALLAGGLYRGAARALSIGASVSTVPTTTIKRRDAGRQFGVAHRAHDGRQ
jgi:hypothetical protein